MKDLLRILTVADVSPAQIAGGAERVLWEQASRLARRGHEIHLLARVPTDGMPGVLERAGIPIRHFPADRRSPLRFLLSSIVEARRAVSRHLDEHPCDLLHLYQPFSGYGALQATRATEIPILYTFLSPAPLEYRSRMGMTGLHRRGMASRVAQTVLWAIERSCMRRATRIQVLSDFSADQLWRLYGISTDRVLKVPGGVDTELFVPSPDADAARRTLGLSEGRPLLLTIRNLEARMGLDTLIEAMAILRRSLPEALLLIGGAGSLRPSLESLVASLHLEGHVQFLGYLPEAELPRYYQAADAFVLPTRELEGFGLITVEALACGTPVLGTAVGATPEILSPLDSSLIFRDATPDGMARGLQAFLAAQRQDPGAALRLRRACRRHACAHYDWSASVALLEGNVHQLAADDGAAPTSSHLCPACGGLARSVDLAYVGTPYLRCPQCHTGMAAVMPSAGSLRQFYDDEYPRRFPDDCITESRADLFFSIVRDLHNLGAAGRLLDVGCGGGHLLSAARAQGLWTVGTDLSRQACATTRKAGIPAVQADGAALPIRQASVGAVTMVNVVDQTSDPLRTLREANRALAAGGFLALRVPNGAFHRACLRLLAAMGPLARWRGWDRYPTLHLHVFTRRSLQALVERAGFEVLEVRNSPLAAGGLTISCRRRRSTDMRWLTACVATVALGVEILSRGRWLLGPSLELYARRPHVQPWSDS